jgi:hypothetical protein
MSDTPTIAVIVREETGRRLMHQLATGTNLTLSEEDGRELFGAFAQYFGLAEVLAKENPALPPE